MPRIAMIGPPAHARPPGRGGAALQTIGVRSGYHGLMMQGAGWILAMAFGLDRTIDVLIWLVVVLAGSAVLLCVVWWIRRWIWSQDETSKDVPPFTLDELRRMHARGDLSDEQFAAMRSQLTALAGGAMGREGDESPPDRPRDRPHPNPDPPDADNSDPDGPTVS
jgi:uncharacterized membrane protein